MANVDNQSELDEKSDDSILEITSKFSKDTSKTEILRASETIILSTDYIFNSLAQINTFYKSK